jgi:hypothetical protein
MSVHQLKDGRWFVRFYDLLEDDGKNMTNGTDISEHSRLNRQTDTAMEDEINRLHLQNPDYNGFGGYDRLSIKMV